MEEITDILMTEALWNDILIASTFSVILFLIMQKVKELPIVSNNTAIWIANFIISIAIGAPFAFYYYNLPVFEALAVGLFAFIGAPAIYTALKKQNVINYTPKALDDNTVKVDKENVIERTDKEGE